MINLKATLTGSSLSPKHSVDLTSPIGIKWTEIGGEVVTGKPVSDVLPLADGIGQTQLFEIGAIFWSPAFGAVYMSELVWRKWSSPSVQALSTATGANLQQFLGYPTDDTVRRDESGFAIREWTWFERGMIYVGPEGSFTVSSEIYVHYRELGGLTGFLGYPVSDERSAPGGGRVSHFTSGDIYYHDRTGAYEVHGAIRDRYNDLGGPGGVLKYPVSDEESLSRGGVELGRFNRFENGSGIYWSAHTGAWEVAGQIWTTWMDWGGYDNLGLPTSGETDTPTSAGRFNEFEKGVIVSHGAGSPYAGTYLIKDLELVISEFNVNEDFNVQVHITATPSDVNHGRMPASDEYDKGSKVFDPPVSMVSIDVVRADSVITVWLNAIHEVLIGKDTREGTITANFSIDNVWGLLDTDFKHHAGSFDAWFRVQPKTSTVTNDPDALFWPFTNTSTGKLSWETYARTFRDVAETDKNISLDPTNPRVHPWEIFFYETVYNSLAENGACFGTCLEAVYAREKRSLFLEPLLSNPFNPYVRNHPATPPSKVLDPSTAGDGVALDEINVKHGYQLGGGFIEWFLGKWTAGALHDPERAYRDSYADYQSGNWPLLTISDKDKFAQDSSHVVMPYDWDPVPDKIGTGFPTQPLIIHVKNPNFPLAKKGESHCKIEIDHLTWQFKFLYADGDEWHGSAGSGGRLLSIPFSELNARPVTPGYNILELLVAGVIVIMAGDGETEQITDSYGRTFFRYDQSPLVPILNKGINWDPVTRIPNMIEIPRLGRKPKSKRLASPAGGVTLGSNAELYYHRPALPPAGSGDRGNANDPSAFSAGLPISRADSTMTTLSGPIADRLHYQILGKAKGGVQWMAIAPRMSAAVTAETESGILDSIYLAGSGGHFQNVTVQFPKATTTRRVSFALAGWRGAERAQSRSFVIDNLSLTSADSVRAQLTDGGKQLVLENSGPAKTFDLRLLSGLSATEIASRSGLSLDAGSITRISPSDWSAAAGPVALQLLDATGTKVLKTQLV
jgi:hypothetical protein